MDDTRSIPTHGSSPRCSESSLRIAPSSPACRAIASHSRLRKDEEASLNGAVKHLHLVQIYQLSKACNLRPKERSTNNNNRKTPSATIPDQSSTDTSAAQVYLQVQSRASSLLHGHSVEPFWPCLPSWDCSTGHVSDGGSCQPLQGRTPAKGRWRCRHVQSVRVDTTNKTKSRSVELQPVSPDNKTPIFLLVPGAISPPA